MQKIYLLAIISLISTVLALGQAPVKGKIVGKDGQPMPGVSILVQGTTIATITNENGEFEINVPATEAESGKKAKLVISFIGSKTIVKDADADFSNVVLEDDVNEISEVIVSGMAIEKDKAKLGYSVQRIDGEELAQSRETNIVNALNAKVAGVQIISSAGTPGAASTIRIRGAGTFQSDFQPLFVIDGIPIDNSEAANAQERDGNIPFTQGVNNSNRAVDLASEDVENVTVLKGPAATALYGIRAANGAVIITTKKGKFGSGKPQFSFNSGYSFDIVNKLPEFQTKYSQGTGGFDRTGTNASGSWGARVDTLGRPTYDNVKNFFQVGHTRNIGFSASAGNDKANYLISVNNSKQDGIIALSEFERTSIRLTSEYKLTDKLKVMGSANYINSNGVRMQQGSNLSGLMLTLFRTPISFDNSNGYSEPWNEPRAYLNEDGTQRAYRVNGTYDNPWFSVARNQTKDNVNRLIAFGQAKYEFTPFLTATYRLGVDHYGDNRRGGFGVNSAAYGAGRTFENRITNSDITSDLILTFNKKFGQFEVIANAGHNMFDSRFDQVYTQGDGLSIPTLQSLSNASTFFAYQSNTWLRRYGVYADVNLGLKNRYYLNVTGRNDWTSTLKSGNNSFFYPSVSLSYILTEDLKDFGILADDKYLSYVKLRGSYAQVGRDAAPYSTYTKYGQPLVGDGYTNGIPFPYSGTPGFQAGTNDGSSQPQLGNPKLKPEQNTTYEAGTEIALFRKRLAFDFTYYYSENKNLIVNAQLASSSGFQYKFVNTGEIRNQGIEIVATAIPIKTKDFQWSMNVNFTRNRSKVISLADGIENIFLNGFTGSGSYAIPGQPYGVFFGTAYAKNSEGKIIVDANGYPVLDTKAQVLGNPLPNWTTGIRNSFSYKGITLSALFDIRSGGTVWNGTRGALSFFGRSKETEDRTKVEVLENTVKQNGTDANGNPIYVANDIPIAKDQFFWQNYSSFQGGNDYSMENVSWVRLRDVSIGYTFPKSIVSKLKLTSLDFSLFSRNLFLLTNYTGIDPETNLTGSSNGLGLDYFNMPNTKSYGANLKVTF